MSRGSLGAVSAVTGDGVSDMLHVGTYLVFTPGVEVDIHEGVTRARAHSGPASYSALGIRGLFIGDIHEMSCVLGQEGVDGSGVLFKSAFNNGGISSVEYHVVPVVLHGVLSLDAFGKEHKARCVLVEAVDDKDFVGRVDALDVVAQYRVGCQLLFVVSGDREQAVSFIYNDDVIVFIDDFETRVGESLPGARDVDFYFSACGYGVVEGCDNLASGHNLSIFHPSLDGCTANVAKGRHEYVH